MKILVFGSTGMTGQEVVKQALASRHQVTAFARSPGKIRVDDAGLRVIRGTLDDRESILAAMEGQDAVVSTLGAANPWEHSAALVTGVSKIVECMERSQSAGWSISRRWGLEIVAAI